MGRNKHESPPSFLPANQGFPFGTRHTEYSTPGLRKEWEPLVSLAAHGGLLVRPQLSCIWLVELSPTYILWKARSLLATSRCHSTDDELDTSRLVRNLRDKNIIRKQQVTPSVHHALRDMRESFPPWSLNIAHVEKMTRKSCGGYLGSTLVLY